MMICSPCVPVLAATKRVISFNDQPEIIYVYVSYMECTHKHGLKRARQTHDIFIIIEHCLPTPIDRIRKVVSFKFGSAKQCRVSSRDHLTCM